MSRVGLVVDSTADYDPSFYVEHEVALVPLTVRFGEEAHLDWVEMRPEEFYPRLAASSELPKTSQPSVNQFVEAYEAVAETCDSIISLHLSSGVSGTVQSAQIAAGQVEVPVTVIDSKSASAGIGVLLAEALEARDAGVSHDEIVNLLNRRVPELTTLLCVDSLRYLQMGGRIGKASALAGAMLRIRPVLRLDEDGVVAPYKKVKGLQRAYRETIRGVKEIAGGKAVVMGFAHAANPDAVPLLKRLLDEEGVPFRSVAETQVGSVIGTYIGPGAFGVFFRIDDAS